jgi:hypothetical protein
MEELTWKPASLPGRACVAYTAILAADVGPVSALVLGQELLAVTAVVIPLIPSN